MKKILLTFLVLVNCAFVLANENPHNILYDNAQVIYNPVESSWATDKVSEDGITLTKKLISGDGGYSLYNKEDGSLAFALNTECEIIKDGNLIIVDNNLLKYSKLVFDGERHFLEPLSDEEIQNLFPDAEIFKISAIDSDNKMWIHKPFMKKRTFILVNDTDRYFHRLSCASKNVQDSEIKGLITISRYGIYRFTHFGERNGKITFYIR